MYEQKLSLWYLVPFSHNGCWIELKCSYSDVWGIFLMISFCKEALKKDLSMTEGFDPKIRPSKSSEIFQWRVKEIHMNCQPLLACRRNTARRIISYKSAWSSFWAFTLVFGRLPISFELETHQLPPETVNSSAWGIPRSTQHKKEQECAFLVENLSFFSRASLLFAFSFGCINVLQEICVGKRERMCVGYYLRVHD